MKTCGQYGGTKGSGAPCQRPAGWGTDSPGSGRCRNHPGEPVETAVEPEETPNTSAHLKKAAMLAAYAELGNVSKAAEAAEIGRTTHYDWLDADPEYKARFQEAHRLATERLEEEARRRAVDGWVEPVFYKGERVGGIRKYSDTLLIFLLKGNNPEKFRERVEHSGVVGMPERPEDYHRMTDEEIAARAARAASRAIGKAAT